MSEEQTARQEDEAESPHPEIWRDEIQTRVAHYRSRRGGRRLEGAFSMRFPFPPSTAPENGSAAVEAGEPTVQDMPLAAGAELPPSVDEGVPTQLEAPVEQAPEPSAAVEQAELAPAVADAAPQEDAKPVVSPVPRPKARRKVIAFPRQASAPPPPVYRLADPVVPEQPRILDVPEELEAFPTTPLLDGLDVLPDPRNAPAVPPDHVELPLEAAPTSRRACAGLIDGVLVAAGAAMCAAAAYRMLPKPAAKPVLLTAASLPVLFWAIYQYLFLMYTGATPGMRLLHLRLTTFKGQRANWRQRRSRVVGLYFSAASLMMGVLWALVDVDALCWHDRISRTYLSQRR